jgi:uncharacterized protein
VIFGLSWLFVSSLLALGAATGFLAGLLGIGGGMLLVPFLTMLFTAQQFSLSHVVHMAVATSLTTILFTSVSSVRAHHKHGAVMWNVVKAMALGAFLGTAIGAQLASIIPTGALALLFAFFVSYSALQMLRSKKASGSGEPELPGKGALFGVGGLIGFVSSLVGAGGGFITVPYLNSRKTGMHRAVATSAAMGFPVAAGGLLGFVIAGAAAKGLPSGSLGYVYLPALFGCAITSVLFAPLGARTAHAMDVARLKRLFAGLLLMLATYMLYKGLKSLGLF